MNIKIGSKIKALRAAGGLTQEKLAEYLGISTQAVSKWELENGYPDIELLPALSNFFGVSADELLGIDVSKNREVIAGYIKRYREISGDVSAQLALMREAAAKYPGSYVVLQHLMYALVSNIKPHGVFDTSGKSYIYELNALNALKQTHKDGITSDRSAVMEEENRLLLAEAVAIAERILEDCTDDAIRHSAIQVLCFCYPLAGKTEAALALVRSMPPLCLSREFLTEEIVSGGEKIRQMQHNVCLLTDALFCEICAVADPDLQNLNILSLDDKIKLFELAGKVYQLVFEDGDYDLYHERLAYNNRIIASLTLHNRPPEDTLAYLEKAAYHAISADALREKAKAADATDTLFTSLAVNRLTLHDMAADEDTQTPDYQLRQRTATNRIVYKIEELPANQSGILLRKLEQPRYDPIRNTGRFRAVVDQLTSHCKSTI